MKYFSDCKTLEDVKRVFKDCAKRLHPDAGGNAEEFKAMMEEYEAAFNRCKDFRCNSEGETYEKTTTETAKQYADIINKVIHFDGVKIEVIGSWVWLSGNTMTYRDEIKSAGFWWSKSKKAWYYTGEKEHKRRKGHYNMKTLREKWGTIEVETEKQARIA